MTVPVIIEHAITHQRTEVPYEIVRYCDDVTIDADREDLRYLDCVYMNMGYYGNDSKLLKRMRDEHFNNPRPIFPN